METDFVKLDINDLVNLKLNDLIACINKPGLNVMDPPGESVKKQFSLFVNKEISDRRKNSSISSLRSFHNEIKRQLIENISRLSGKTSLLDIAVGRGGDISKWKSSNIRNVFGFDKSRDSIESINPFNQGARERLRNFRGVKVEIEFGVGDATQPTPELLKSIQQFMLRKNISGFEILSCQFALHYFFQSETALRTVFENFGKLVKPGGYFIGTSVDGQRIIDLLKQNRQFNSTLLTVTKSYKAVAPRSKYNNMYTFKINDSFDQGNYFNTMGESVEYLVFIQELTRIAKEYNFEPQHFNFFEPIPNKRDEYPKTAGFVSFEEIYKRKLIDNQLSPEELPINNLYTTFVFKKV